MASALNQTYDAHTINVRRRLPRCSGPRDAGGFGIAVNMQVTDASIPQAELEALVKEAHEQICPYSHATRNNVAVDFVVKGG